MVLTTVCHFDKNEWLYYLYNYNLYYLKSKFEPKNIWRHMWMLPMVKYTKLFGYKVFQILKVVHLSCSWQQTTKQPILFSPILSMNFSQFQEMKMKTTFSLVQNWDKTCLGPIKRLFSFSTAQTEKNNAPIFYPPKSNSKSILILTYVLEFLITI